MPDMPEAEARHLLSHKYRCIEAPDWSPAKNQPTTRVIECGLLSEDDRSVGLFVSLRCSVRTRIAIPRYVFTVFKLGRGPAQRVYQLDVSQWRHLPSDVHSRPHEHIGSLRVVGDDTWITWRYDDALRRFQSVANIEFEPEITDPSHLRLV